MTLVLLFNQYEATINATIMAVQAPQVASASLSEYIAGSAAVATATGIRTYGRINQVGGMGGTWTVVETDANGHNDQVYLTTLCQTLKLNLNESPFFANYGIPAQQSVVTQVFPDYYATQTQTQFAPYFASLVITRVANSSPPVYRVNAIAHSGAILQATVAT